MKTLLPILFILLFTTSCDNDDTIVSGVSGFEVPDGYVFLWGDFYNIEGTTELDSNDDGNDNYINVDCQNLVGQSIPSEIGQLVNLRVIDLNDCGLVGEIPPEIENLTNLIDLDLGNNQLTGEILEEIGNLTNLSRLDLGFNQLTGEIPEEIGNLTYLIFLELGINQLTGEIPSEICDQGDGTPSVDNNQLCPPYPSCIYQGDILTQDTSNCP